MSIEGWYYLHTNKTLIYKRELGGTAADIRESPFALALWPVRTSDREGAWNILVEALALGADRAQVRGLEEKWGCTNEDAGAYAERVGCVIKMDGDKWCAHRRDFVNLQESEAGFGATALEAMAALCKELAYVPVKMWGPTFKSVLRVENKK